mmetsp:Transcript_16891/g.34902  ORF Transcript_16891/g.34902 Transcript_16891/m.34902 type:complete len:262 (-) Transcript_16891:1078-1863(-)
MNEINDIVRNYHGQSGALPPVGVVRTTLPNIVQSGANRGIASNDVCHSQDSFRGSASTCTGSPVIEWIESLSVATEASENSLGSTAASAPLIVGRTVLSDPSRVPSAAPWAKIPRHHSSLGARSRYGNPNSDVFGLPAAPASVHSEKGKDLREEQLRSPPSLLAKKDLSSFMKEWLRSNWTNPYPDEDGLEEMARECGVSTSVVSNWLINARTRKWRPAILKAMELHRSPDFLLEDSLRIFDGGNESLQSHSSKRVKRSFA